MTQDNTNQGQFIIYSDYFNSVLGTAQYRGNKENLLIINKILKIGSNWRPSRDILYIIYSRVSLAHGYL